MANEKSVGATREAARGLVGIAVDSLLEKPKWGSLNFRDIAGDLQLLRSLANHLVDLPIEYMPDSTLEQAAQCINRARKVVEAIGTFDILAAPNPAAERQDLADGVRQEAQTLLAIVQGWVGFLAYQKGDVQQNLAALNRAVADASEALDRANKYATEKSEEVDRIVAAAREASAKVGVGHFTEDFAGEALRLDVEAARWLKVTGGLAILTLVAALVLALVGLPANATAAEIAHHVSSKVIVLVVLMTATVWCGRIYKATKHQAVTNQHRANALKTFQAFVKAALDDATRDAVLLETTRSIFTIAPSGYLETSEPSAEPVSKLMEIIRSPRAAA